MPSEEGKVSKCCGAAVKIKWDAWTTGKADYASHWHECTGCGKPCDVVSANRWEGER